VAQVEGRKSHAELRPELVALVRQLRRRRPKGGQRSLRDIAAARNFEIGSSHCLPWHDRDGPELALAM
jgi:hypothetical protein